MGVGTQGLLRLGLYAGLSLFVAALLVNALSWFDLPLISVAIVLFVLIFPLWFGAILAYLRYLRPSVSHRSDIWKPVLEGIPDWQRTLALLLVAYVFINFFASIAVLPGQPEQTSAGYVLMSHGDVVKRLSYSEYVHYLAIVARIFSGHTVVFTLAASGMFRAALRRFYRLPLSNLSQPPLGFATHARAVRYMTRPGVLLLLSNLDCPGPRSASDHFSHPPRARGLKAIARSIGQD